MRVHGFSIPTLTFAILAFAASAAPADPVVTDFASGQMNFQYTGAIVGGFAALGECPVFDDFPDTAGGACIARLIESDVPGSEQVVLLGYGGVENPGGTIDRVDFTIVREGVSQFETGLYVVDAEETVLLTFFDDADDFFPIGGMPPAVISAADVFRADIGSEIFISAYDGETMSGAFSGTMSRDSNPSESITIDLAVFTVTNSPSAVETSDWGRIKAAYRGQ